VWFASGGMVLGYLLGVKFIPKAVSQSTALVMCAILGIATSIIIVLVPASVSIYMVTVLGFANSLLWPAIFPLALADLGKYTKTGSSLLVMGIIGGALLPLLFGYVADVWSYQNAYLVCVPSYLFILYLYE
jgi:fucose permease